MRDIPDAPWVGLCKEDYYYKHRYYNDDYEDELEEDEEEVDEDELHG